MFIDNKEPERVNNSTVKGVVIEDYQHNHENTNSNENSAYQLLVSDTNAISTCDLRQNDNRILSLFSKDSSSIYSFRGLMRNLNIHQQSLARALDRLVDLGLIERSYIGFRLTKNGRSIASVKNFREETSSTNIQRKYSPLLQTYVPIIMKTSEMVKNLVGKWFDKLRWAGMINEGSLYVLQWVSVENGTQSSPNGTITDTTPPFQVNLRVMSDYIILESNAVTTREKVDAMIASYKILHLLTKLFQRRLDSDLRSCITPLREIFGPNN
jgi:DNA-binding Lrp family transcriptional regulator